AVCTRSRARSNQSTLFLALFMTNGYSGTPLFKKLGIKSGHLVYLQNAPSDYFSLLGELPSNVHFVENLDAKVDLIHFFTNDFNEFVESISDFQNRIKDDGMIWVSWFKKAAKLPTELTEDIIRETALKLKLVDVKVCAVDEKWSGLKLVIRKESRK
ncbi:MAG: DUF3052 family protein, partial [Acidobacteriota bacterium]